MSGSAVAARVKADGSTPTSRRTRLRLAVRGAVQGVGFRPFVFRLASELGLCGWVNNSPQGVFIEIEGRRTELEQFLLRLEIEKPPRSFIQSFEPSWLDAVGYKKFEIRESRTVGDKTALVLPDIATCPDCLRDILDPNNRRHRYPFTNCTNCGPRFSIIESIPYDRPNTSMSSFAMCPQCQGEYDDPRDRRFHAQPNACPACGPHLELWNSAADALLGGDAALRAAADAIRRGQIVAAKGLGGFHLLVAAHNETAVRRLRHRKERKEKPFALMFPSVAAIKAECEVSSLEERLLCSPEAPIVLLKKIANRKSQIVNCVAPGNPYLGVMLPCTPLHHLLMADLGFPMVATSGNLKDEPISFCETEALQCLGGIADLFLVHNRPIVRHVDDSIVRVMMGRDMILRRARGYAPLPITLAVPGFKFQVPDPGAPEVAQSALRPPPSESVLAVGAHLKNTVALSVGPHIFISQHIGDLETEQAYRAFLNIQSDFQKLYEVRPAIIATDLHPDYLSTKFARGFATAPAERSSDGALKGVHSTAVPRGGKAVPRSAGRRSPKETPRYLGVQHHIAHVLSCMADNELEPPVLGISWDGTGYGLDGTIWGGEFFLVTPKDVERVASIRSFPLPGGDQAVKEPRRAALGLLYEVLGDVIFRRKDLTTVAAFSDAELALLRSMLRNGLNSPRTSSIGRLFDAVASLTNLRQQTQFEGQAAMDLEFALEGIRTTEFYPLPLITDPSTPVFDWSPMIQAILSDAQSPIAAGRISAKFHNTLAEAAVEMSKRAGQPRIALSGGCFQNRYLTERTVTRLREEGFQPYWHRRVPPNDGGIALGQVVAALRAGK